MKQPTRKTKTTSTKKIRRGTWDSEAWDTSVTWPDTLDLHGRAVVSTELLARAVAEDDHPGDDAVPERHLLRSALLAVNIRKLAAKLRNAGTLVVTPEMARAVVDTYDDQLMCLGSYAWQDAGLNGSPCSCRGPLCAEHAALILVVGVLLHRRMQTLNNPDPGIRGVFPVTVEEGKPLRLRLNTTYEEAEPIRLKVHTTYEVAEPLRLNVHTTYEEVKPLRLKINRPGR